MAVKLVGIITRQRVVRYDGTNGSEIDAALTGMTIVSEAGGEMTYSAAFTGSQHNVEAGDWIMVFGEQCGAPLTDAELNEQFLIVPTADDLVVTAAGVANVPALLLGQSTAVNVTLSWPMVDSDYTAQAWLVGAAGNLSIQDVSVVDEDTVAVEVEAALAYVSGAQVVVAAHRVGV